MSASFQLDALRTQALLKKRLVELTRSYSYLRDPGLMEACTALWNSSESDGGLVGRLWVEGIFPAELGSGSLADLAREGVVARGLAEHLAQTGAFPVDRPLYSHQEAAIRRSLEAREGGRPGLVVTAGTGAGKTESFLLPTLSDLFSVPRSAGGVRAIIVYPMNALVNDQVERIYRCLKGQEEVTVFHFTSETPEDDRRANDAGVPEYERCRIRTRQAARQVPPDILITNYSMLEYMLCRPQDAPFFGPALRTVVLDEAHLYSGTLAAEITLLMRRVLMRAERRPEDVLAIATSATLAGDARGFMSRVFGKAPEQVVIVEGQSARRPLPEARPPAQPCRIEAFERPDLDGAVFLTEQGLVVDPGLTGRACAAVSGLVAESAVREAERESRPAVALWEAMSRAPIVQHLEDVLWESRASIAVPVEQLARALWSDDSPPAVAAVVRLLQWASCARTREDELPLVAHKLHLLVRGASTASACVNPDCSASTGHRLPGGGRIVADARDVCPDCQTQMLTLARCKNCGEWLLAGVHRSTDNTLHPRHRWYRAGDPTPNLRYARIGSKVDGESFAYQVATRRCEDGPGVVGLHWITACSTCGETPESFEAIGLPDSLSLSVVAETALAAMPPAIGDEREWLPARGRRLLVFSDSRREAAHLGPSLTRLHERQLGRALVARALASGSSDEKSLARWRRRVEDLRDELADPGVGDHARRDIQEELEGAMERLRGATIGLPIREWTKRLEAEPLLAEFFHREGAPRHRAETWHQGDWDSNRRAIASDARQLLVNEFVRPMWGGLSLETTGVAEVCYPEIEKLLPPDELLGTLPSASLREALTREWSLFLATLCDTLRQEGALTLGTDDADWEAYDMPLGKWISLDQGGYQLGRFVGAMSGKAMSRRNRFCRDVLLAWGCPPEVVEDTADGVLAGAFATLARGAATVKWIEVQTRQAQAGQAVEALRLVFNELSVRTVNEAYRCRVTGHVWPRSVAGCAPEVGSRGTLTRIATADLDADPRVGRVRRGWAEDEALRTGLWAEEHSAQLAPQENRRLQDLFAKGARNILSATTTLELGIDIGGLVGVLLGNVPPGRAQYRQRGGRAGRRADGSSLVATYARATAFDQSAFLQPEVFFTKPLRKLTVLLDRERFGRRHLHAMLLGDFFRAIYPEGMRVGAMDAFNRMGWLCARPRTPLIKSGAPLPDQAAPMAYGESLRRPREWWKSGGSVARQFEAYLEHLGESSASDDVRRLLTDTPLSGRVSQWKELVEEVRSAFHGAWSAWARDYDTLAEEWANRLGTRETAGAHVRQLNALAHQADALWSTTVIEELSTRQFLPRYGFPVGVQQLTVPKSKSTDSSAPPIRLERAGILAVSEYVPGSRVLVGGRTYRSRGVVRSWADTGFGKKAWMYECQAGHVYYSYTEVRSDACRIPGCDRQRSGSGKTLLLPRYGFTTAAWDPPQWEGRAERTGSTTLATMAFVLDGLDQRRVEGFGGIAGLVVESCEGAEMLAVNRGDVNQGFALCTRCGYADSERSIGQGRMALPKGFETHAPLDSWGSKPCWPAAEAPVLRNHHLAATQATDILQFDFSSVGHDGLSEPVVTTLGHALRLAGAELLEQDHRELGSLACPVGPTGRLGLLVFDGAAGGAGHVLELATIAEEWLRKAGDVMRRSDSHDRNCVTACLECLLTASSQMDMEAGRLQRRQTLTVLDDLLSGKVGAVLSPPPSAPPVPAVSDEERVRRARARAEGAQKKKGRAR